MRDGAKGLTVCMSGCFDMFHQSHKEIIEFGLKLVGYNGILCIAINTDESIKRLKGNDRPKNILEKRITIVEETIKKWIVENRSYPKTFIESFSTEKELASVYDRLKPDIILHGNDITDITRVTGYPKWGILIRPRGTDEEGNDISTTRRILEDGES